LLAIGVAGCAPSVHDISSSDSSLSGCHGTASGERSSDDVYYLTTFGGPSEPQPMSCGSHTMSGSWYYAADKSRFGCGTKLQIVANGRCVIAEVADYGPDVCVENAAGRGVLDASPLVARELFGQDELGWSSRREVAVSIADASAALGPCDASAAQPEAPMEAPASAAPAAPMSEPAPGPSGQPPRSASDCYDDALGIAVPEAACAQFVSGGFYYQCYLADWYNTDDEGFGPLGACSFYCPLP